MKRENIQKLIGHLKIDLDKGRYTQAATLARSIAGYIESVEKIPMPEDITIIGRRWFQRSYGNTYHSV